MSDLPVLTWRGERTRARPRAPRRTLPDWRARDTLAAVVLLGVASVSTLAIRPHLNILSVALLFLILVTLISVCADRWTSIASAMLAFLGFDFFFILPYYSFDVAAADHALILVVFLGAATLTSQLIYRVRAQTVDALARGRQTAIQFELSQALIADVTVAGTLCSITERVAEVLGTESCAVLVLDGQGRLTVRAALGPLPPIDDHDHAAVAAWAVEHRCPAGLGRGQRKYVHPHGTLARRARDPRFPSRLGASLYVPIGVSSRVIGLLYVQNTDTRRQFSDDDQQLLLTFANQIALALERVRLTEEATQVAVLARSDALKSALLSAVSHDLRTPLASIKASATSLLQEGIVWTPADQRDLLLAIDEETDRLTRLVGNLLDLTRIEAGELKPRLEWNDPEDVVRDTVRRAQVALPRHAIRLQLPGDLPPAVFDYIEIAQVLFNLVENAGKYAPPGAAIDVSAQLVGGSLEFAVADRGLGIPMGEEERIFDKFYRIKRHGSPQGAGIGLSICRGIVDAHGGRIWSEPRDGGGTTFRFSLPNTTCDDALDRL